MSLARVMPSIRRPLIVLGLLVAATASGAPPLSMGGSAAAPSTVAGSRAMQLVSAARTAAAAGFAVKITPGSGVGQGDTVYISGNAPVDAAHRPAKLTVTPPHQGSPVSGNVPLRQSDGFFMACYNLTSVPGDYRVRVESPAGGAVGTTTFTVDPGFGPPDPDPELGNLGVAVEHHVEGLLHALPASPAEEDLQAKLDDLRPQMATAIKQIQKYDAALKEVLDAFKDYPNDRPQYEGLLQTLEDWNDKAKAVETALRDEMRADEPGTVRCDDVAHLEKELTDLVDLITELEGPMHAVADFEKRYTNATGLGLEDNVECVNWQQAVAHQPFDPKLRAALDKVDPAGAPAAFFDALLKVAKEAVAAGSEDLFSVYCEQFVGPFTAGLAATFSSKNGMPWWKYSLGLKGTLTLRYAKGASGQGPIKLTGEFDGDAIDFTMHENALRVQYPKLMAGALLFHKAILPDPMHFNLPVEGEIAGQMLTINPPTGGSDPTAGAVAHVTYVVVTPLTLAPQVVKFDLPYLSARSVISRAMSDKPVQFLVKVDRQSKVSTIAKTFTYTRNHPGAVAYGQFKLTVRACNPACS